MRKSERYVVTLLDGTTVEADELSSDQASWLTLTHGDDTARIHTDNVQSIETVVDDDTGRGRWRR